MLSQPDLKIDRVMQICNSFVSKRVIGKDCVCTSMDFTQWNNNFHLPAFEAITKALQPILGENNITSFCRLTMAWFNEKRLLFPSELLEEL